VRSRTKRPMVSKCIFKMVPEQASEYARPGPMDLPFSMRVIELIVLPCLASSIISMATATLQAPVIKRFMRGAVDVELPLACLSNVRRSNTLVR